VPVICPTSQAKPLRRIGTTGKSVALPTKQKQGCQRSIAQRSPATDRSGGYYFRGFLHRGEALESQAYRGLTRTTGKSSVIFMCQTRKNTGKTGVSDKKTQKTPRKTV
jgi:hypothetical protein